MKKRMLIALVVALVLATTASVAWADDPVEYTNNIVKEDHKVKNKWDLSGTFVAHPGYDWGGLAEGATWTYSIHIKEAMDGEASVGSIHFMTGDIDVVGHVKATDKDWAYWTKYPGGDPNLAAVGRAEYEDTSYYFMFLYAERAIWFALSETPYADCWANQTVWGSSLRAYQLHSKVPDGGFTLDHKAIH